jgi:hypothetical protein
MNVPLGVAPLLGFGVWAITNIILLKHCDGRIVEGVLVGDPLLLEPLTWNKLFNHSNSALSIHFGQKRNNIMSQEEDFRPVIKTPELQFSHSTTYETAKSCYNLDNNWNLYPKVMIKYELNPEGLLDLDTNESS